MSIVPTQPEQEQLVSAPPALEGTHAQSVESVAVSQSAATLASARLPRRTAVESQSDTASYQQRGRHA